MKDPQEGQKKPIGGLDLAPPGDVLIGVIGKEGEGKGHWRTIAKGANCAPQAEGKFLTLGFFILERKTFVLFCFYLFIYYYKG